MLSSKASKDRYASAEDFPLTGERLAGG